MKRKHNSSKSTVNPVSSSTNEKTTLSSKILNFILQLPLKTLSIGLLLLSAGAIALSKRKEPESLKLTNDICEQFGLHRIKGSLDEHTTRIIIGELHNEKSEMSSSTLNCIEEIGKRIGPHEVFLESVPSEEEISCSSYDLSFFDRKCKGWDDTQHIKKQGKKLLKTYEMYPFHELYNYFVFLTGKSQYDATITKNSIIEKMDHYLKSIHKTYEKTLAELKNEFKTNIIPKNPANSREYKLKGISITIHQCEKLINLRKIKTYETIFNENKHILIEKMPDFEATSETLLQRNKALIATLRNSTAAIKIAQVGEGHIKMDEENAIARKAVEYVINELEKEKDTNPYAILALI